MNTMTIATETLNQRLTLKASIIVLTLKPSVSVFILKPSVSDSEVPKCICVSLMARMTM